MTTQPAKLEQLLDLVEGRLSHDEVVRLTTELEADPEFSAAHEWVRKFLSMSERTTLVPAPASTHTMLTRLLPEPRPTITPVRQFLDIVAKLIRDVTGGPRFAGARGVALDSKRQLLFGAGNDTDVTIELEFIADALRVSGQLLTDDAVAAISLTGDHSAAEFKTDVSGEFSTTIPVPTSAQLSITTTSQHIHLDLTPYLDPAGSARHGTT